MGIENGSGGELVWVSRVTNRSESVLAVCKV
jgi:hypothetical protein